MIRFEITTANRIVFVRKTERWDFVTGIEGGSASDAAKVVLTKQGEATKIQAAFEEAPPIWRRPFL